MIAEISPRIVLGLSLSVWAFLRTVSWDPYEHIRIESVDDPVALRDRWVSGGIQRKFMTYRRRGEEPASQRMRHARYTAKMRIKYPPDRPEPEED